MGDSLCDPAVQVIDPMLGWGRVAPGRVSVHEMTVPARPGDHATAAVGSTPPGARIGWGRQ